MRVPREWLDEYCDGGLPSRDLGERLTMTGTKLEAVHHHGVAGAEHFVVGKVLSAERHPDADRLSVCRVDVGGEERGIVCGAPNVAAGQTVAVAGVGAVMPDGTRLKKAKLRGVESNGMILAEDELAIGTDHDGIMVLGDELAAGTPLAGVLPIATDVLEFEITPNRPDCLGIYGIAREVHATFGTALAAPPWAQDAGTSGPLEGARVEVEVPGLCPRFTARIFDGVTLGPSPAWLKARLMAAGQRPINNVVDITNYVMLLTGQPLHAFDLDRVAGQHLVVRAARAGETIDTLDGATRVLEEGEIVIDDDEGPTSLAGVMGGARSEVAADTKTVLLEVASWHAPTIQRTSARLALRSEASGRFEKGLSTEQTLEAQAVATQLMIDLCGATVRPGTIDVGGSQADPPPIRLRSARVTRLLGVEIPRERQEQILTSLEFATVEVGEDLDVVVPHFRRADVTREADLVEEVARIDGVDNLPATLPSRRGTSGRLTAAQRLRRRAEDVLVGRGLHEIVGWSFTDPGFVDRLRLPEDDPRRRFVTLANPMSEDQSVQRTTLLGSLLDVARHNAARGTADLALFESGAIYLDVGEKLPLEVHALGAVFTGRTSPASWGSGDGTWDFFSAKAVLGAVLDTLRVPWDLRPPGHPFLHPGRSARVHAGETELGWIGEVHPLVAATWDFRSAVVAFELDLGLVTAAAPELQPYGGVPAFPAVRHDLALVFGEDVAWTDVERVVREAAGPLLEVADVFDVYPLEGRVSIAIHLEFRASDRTLTDEDVRTRVDKVVERLRSELGGEARA